MFRSFFFIKLTFIIVTLNLYFCLTAGCYDKIEKTLGPVGVVVNNAGIGETDYKKCIDVNLVDIYRVA